jgi:hypothetical protein
VKKVIKCTGNKKPTSNNNCHKYTTYKNVSIKALYIVYKAYYVVYEAHHLVYEAQYFR